METAKIDSPRGSFAMSARPTTRCRTSTCARSRARRTRSVGVAVKELADPAARLQAVSPRPRSPGATSAGCGPAWGGPALGPRRRRLRRCSRFWNRALFTQHGITHGHHTFLIQLLNGVQYGLLLFLVASGLTLIFGIMGIINLAHGSFYMIGAYMAFTLPSLTGNFVAHRGRRRAVGAARLRARMGASSPPVQARSPGAGAADLWAHPDVRGAAQHHVGNDVHGVPVPGDPRRVDPLTGDADLSGVSPVHVGGVPRARGGLYC